jgi:hypothetical protein
VEYLVAAVNGGVPASARLVSIGPVTSQALRDHGLEPHVEAVRHDVDGLLEALVADAAQSARTQPTEQSAGAQPAGPSARARPAGS